MGSLYEGCWHKLDRGKEHLDELQHHVGAWANLHTKPPYAFRKEFNRKRNFFTFRIESVDELPVEWSLIAGDVLTNFRAALDYLAYDLVGRGKTPHLREEKNTWFPIAMKKVDFKGQVNGGMPGISRKQRAIVKLYQPYRWGGARRRHPFALLNTFVKRDKHREIQPVATHNVDFFRAEVVDVNDFVISRVVPGRAFGRGRKLTPYFEPGAEVARVYGKKTGPNPDVIMGFYAPVAVAFKDAPAWFPDALEGMGQMITMLFSEIEPVP